MTLHSIQSTCPCFSQHSLVRLLVLRALQDPPHHLVLSALQLWCHHLFLSALQLWRHHRALNAPQLQSHHRRALSVSLVQLRRPDPIARLTPARW